LLKHPLLRYNSFLLYHLMAIDQRRTNLPFEDFQSPEDNYVRITRSLSFKKPKVEQTIVTWKPAKKQKSFKQRCTRRETGGFCMTNIGIISVAVLFCYFIPKNLFVSNDDTDHNKNWSENFGRLLVFVLAITLSLMSILSLWFTYITDPGVIPRRSEFEDRLLNHGERLCPECKVIKPPRGKHCRYCNHCVEVFDHHCPYAGVCIGNGNYLFFCLLLSSGLLSTTFVATFSVWFLKDNWPVSEEKWGRIRIELIVALILTVICSLIFLLIGHLSLYHVFIIATGQTTNEWVKTKRDKKGHQSVSNLDTPSKEPLLGGRTSREATSFSDTRYSVTTDTKQSYTQYEETS